MTAESIRLALSRLEMIDPDVGERRSDTRERILGAALRLFASAGFLGTSIREIAHEVGIKPPGVYSHFESKEAILAAAVARALADSLRFVVEPDDSINDADEVEFLVRKHVRFQIANAAIAMPSETLLANVRILQELDRHHLDALQDAERLYVGLFETAIARFVGPGAENPRTLAHVIITMCDGVNRWYRPGGRMDVTEVELYIWKLARAALRA